MVLPLNLAMTPLEIAVAPVLPDRVAWMSCHFCSDTEGIANIPEDLPKGAMLILNDRESCAGHSPDLVARQLLDLVHRCHCESVLLDFQRPPEPESTVMVSTLVQALPYPVAVTESFAEGLSCPVFLSPCPPHRPLSAHLLPWSGREIWLEAALCQEKITVTKDGTTFSPVYPVKIPEGGFYCDQLHCRYRTSIFENRIEFTLFDTRETLQEKLNAAKELGVCRAVGIWQELGTFLAGTESA